MRSLAPQQLCILWDNLVTLSVCLAGYSAALARNNPILLGFCMWLFLLVFWFTFCCRDGGYWFGLWFFCGLGVCLFGLLFLFLPFNLNNKILHNVVRKAEVENHLCYFFQLQAIIIVTNSFGLCISFALTFPNEYRYLIYPLLPASKVIVYSSGSDIQPECHAHPLWDFPRRISIFLFDFEEKKSSDFY